MEQILYPYKNALWALRPCKAFGRSISASLPNPQTHFPRWKAVYAWLALHRAKPLCIHARHPCRGYITGATAPRPSKDACSQPHKATARCSGTNGWRPVGGYAPKQGCFDCLPKVLHDAKPTEQAISDTPIFRKHKGLSTDWNTLSRVFQTFSTICYGLCKSARIFCTFLLFSWTKRASVVYYI